MHAGTRATLTGPAGRNRTFAALDSSSAVRYGRRALGPSAPASSDSWSFTENDTTLMIALHGDFDEAQAKGLDLALRERMTRITPGVLAVVFDLNALQRCSVEGRAMLAELQRYLGEVARRTAYVTNRPLFRGVALWICHSAPDANARAFPSADAATGWLAASEGRGELLQRSASTWIDRARALVFAKEAST